MGPIQPIGEEMKFRGKVITGSSLLMVLGVLCSVTVVASSLVLLSLPVSTTSNNVVAKPISLDLTNSGGGFAPWPTTDAIQGQQYGQNVTASTTSTWTGSYQIQMTITVTGTISVADFAVSYTLPGGSSSTALASGDWTHTTSTMTALLPAQTDTGTPYSALYHLTIQVNGAYTDCVIGFQAVQAVV